MVVGKNKSGENGRLLLRGAQSRLEAIAIEIRDD
jgi:hypothetical protein